MRWLFIYFFVSLFLLVISAFAVRTNMNYENLVFSFDVEDTKEGIISIKTDTEPLLISVKKSAELDKFLEIIPSDNVRVTKDNPLVLRVLTTNPNTNIDGFIVLNFLYEKLPENINYYGDDTLRIPIKIDINGADSLTKLEITISEQLLPGEEATPLGVGIILPIAVIIILLLIFKSKWKKKVRK